MKPKQMKPKQINSFYTHRGKKALQLSVQLSALVLLSATLAACTPKKTDSETAGTLAKPAATASKNDIDTAPTKTTALAVQVVSAEQGRLDVQRTASAIIQAQKDSNVAAQSSGTVLRILVPEGASVSAGQVVIQLDSIQQTQALENAKLQVQQAQITLNQTRNSTEQAAGSLQSSIQSAQASLSQASQNAQSAENLYKLGGMSQADLNAARANLASAKSQLASARNNLSQNGRSAQSSVPLQESQLLSAQTSVRQAEVNLSRTNVRAPFAGIIAELKTEVGEFAAQGNAVFRLVDPRTIRAKFNVPAADANTLSEGSALNLGYGGVNYVATVVDSSSIAGTDRLVPITARVQGGDKLPIGSSAQVRYKANLGNGVLIPSSAVQVDGGENAVYIANGNTAKRQVIKVIAESNGKLAVNGVSAGQLVINPVPSSIQDGVSIKVDTASAKASP